VGFLGDAGAEATGEDDGFHGVSPTPALSSGVVLANLGLTANPCRW